MFDLRKERSNDKRVYFVLEGELPSPGKMQMCCGSSNNLAFVEAIGSWFRPRARRRAAEIFNNGLTASRDRRGGPGHAGHAAASE